MAKRYMTHLSRRVYYHALSTFISIILVGISLEFCNFAWIFRITRWFCGLLHRYQC